MKSLALKLCILLVVLLVVYIFSPLPKTSKTFYFSSSNSDAIIKILEENGYKVRWIDRLMLEYSKMPTKGWYSVACNSCTRFSFFTTLHEKKTKTMNIVVYAGETAEALTLRLANDMKLDPKKLLQYYHKHTLFQEADIFAGSYTLARNADENTSMAYLFDISRKSLVSYAVKYFKDVPELVELKVLLTMASIIQKESNDIEEMPLISSVIYNRLEKGMKLQMDSTLNYGKYSHQKVTASRIRHDKSKYNTYKYRGLPPEPVCNVELSAIKAAIFPAKTKYLYFVMSKKGTHRFTSNYSTHIRNIRNATK